MKWNVFSEQDKETNARTGFFSNNAADKVICKTPHCILVTSRGSLPHVTNDALSEFPCLGLQLETFDFLWLNSNSKLKGSDILREFGAGMHEYCQLQPHPLYLSFVSQQQVDKITFSAKRQQFHAYQRGNTITFSWSDYLELVQTSYCDMVECPSVVTKDDSKNGGVWDSNRLKRDCEQSTQLQYEFIQQWSQQHGPSFEQSMCIGVVQGGMKEEQRRRHAQSISQLNGIGGFYIDVLPAKLTEQQKLASISISNLPPWLPRGMEASGSLEQVLALVACGVDYFISSYPYILSTHGYALDLPHKNNLWNIQYRNNTDPLSLHCSCPVCRRYTRAYLNHLLNTHEMLAMTLLMIHNSAQYIQFFHQIQQAIETKTFGAFQKQFLASRRVDDS